MSHLPRQIMTVDKIRTRLGEKSFKCLVRKIRYTLYKVERENKNTEKSLIAMGMCSFPPSPPICLYKENRDETSQHTLTSTPFLGSRGGFSRSSATCFKNCSGNISSDAYSFEEPNGPEAILVLRRPVGRDWRTIWCAKPGVVAGKPLQEVGPTSPVPPSSHPVAPRGYLHHQLQSPYHQLETLCPFQEPFIYA